MWPYDQIKKYVHPLVSIQSKNSGSHMASRHDDSCNCTKCTEAVNKLREDLRKVYEASVLRRDLHAASAEVFENAGDKLARESRKLSATASSSPHPVVADQAARISAETAARADGFYDQAAQFRADAKVNHDVSQQALQHDAALSSTSSAGRYSSSPVVSRSPLHDDVSTVTDGTAYDDGESYVPPLSSSGGRRYGSRHYRW